MSDVKEISKSKIEDKEGDKIIEELVALNNKLQKDNENLKMKPAELFKDEVESYTDPIPSDSVQVARKDQVEKLVSEIVNNFLIDLTKDFQKHNPEVLNQKIGIIERLIKLSGIYRTNLINDYISEKLIYPVKARRG